MIRSIATALAFALSLGGAIAHADSFKTEPSGGSKTAAKVGPAPYTGASFTTKQAMKVVQKGTTLMRSTKNAAIRMDAIRVVDSATMESATARKAFARNLATLAKSGDASDKFARGYNLLMRTGGRGALKMVNTAAKALPKDSAVQLGAFQANADYSVFGGKMKRGERVSTRATAGKFYKAAKALEAKASRPLVKTNLEQTEKYAALYPELTKYLK